jgi:WD40 repeat protein
MAELFISYAREDKDFVQRLHRALELKGRQVWIDLEGILPSAEWRQEIFEAIEAADAIVLIMSPHSVASKICSDELSHAIQNNKRIIPILREDLDDGALPDAVRERQWLFFKESDDFEQSLSKLIAALDTDLHWVRAHTRLLTRAIEWDRHKRNYVFSLRGSDLREAESLLTKHEVQEPRFLPLQVDYILASRKDANRIFRLVLGSIAAAMLTVVILGALLWLKRAESIFTEAANFREMGIAELGSNNPLAAEVLLAQALLLSNNQGARERLVEARAKSPELLWISPIVPENSMLAVSGDGMLFATLTGSTVSIWSVPERQRVRAFRTRTSPKSVYASFAKNDRFFAIASLKDIEIWDLHFASGQPIRIITNAHEISSVSFSVNSTLLLVGGENGSILSWNIQSTEPASPFELRGHADRVLGIAISSDGRELVSGSWDHKAKVWDLGSYTEDASFTKHDDALLCVAISPDGEIVASAGWDDTIWVWDRRTAKPIRALVGHKGSVLSLAFSPDGTWLASGSEDRTARLWDVEKGKHVLTFPGHGDDVKSVAFIDGPNGKYQLVTGDAIGVVRLWDISKVGQREELITIRGHRGAVTTVTFHPNASIIASSSLDKSIAVWEIGSNRLLNRFDDQADYVSAVAFSPDGRRIASVNKTATARVWDLETGKLKSFGDDAADDKLRHVVFSRNGSFLVGGSEEGKIKVWNAQTGQLLR